MKFKYLVLLNNRKIPKIKTTRQKSNLIDLKLDLKD